MGPDDLTGGSGADKFIYITRIDSRNSSPDIIADFSQAQHDLIGLTQMIDGKFDFVGSKGFSGDAPEVRYQTGEDETSIKVDINGDARADMTIMMEGIINFTAHDFLL